MPFKKNTNVITPIWTEQENLKNQIKKEELKKAFSENPGSNNKENNPSYDTVEENKEKKVENITNTAEVKEEILIKTKKNSSKKEKIKIKPETSNETSVNTDIKDVSNNKDINSDKKIRNKGNTGINFADIVSNLDDKELKEILEYLRQKNYDFINKIQSNSIKLINEKEAIETLKKEILSFFKDEYSNLKIKVSEKRKKGEDMTDISIRLMSLPLKIKMFESSFSKKDFYTVINLIEEFEKQV